MSNFDSKHSQPKLDTRQGWVVQVYDSNRRLLCILEPSHAWSFFIGCAVGLLLSVTWINIASYSSNFEPNLPTESPKLQVD